MKILVIRMLGFGDVLCIGLAGLRRLRARHPDARFSFLTYAAGREIIELEPGLETIYTVPREDWPDEFARALPRFVAWADRVARAGFDVIYNLDTWFMPCLMTRMLRDAGADARGNFTRYSLAELGARMREGDLPEGFATHHKHYLDSDFPHVQNFYAGPWWETFPDPGAYPRFYLEHCCGLGGPIDFHLDVPADEALRREAAGRPVVALATRARTKNRQYPHGDALRRRFEDAGCLVWEGFDGSVPLRTTLGRLRASDLIVTMASAPQWLAAAVGCPALLIPGPVPPAVLGAEASVERFLDCQYCFQEECVEGIDFACVNVDPETVFARARPFLP